MDTKYILHHRTLISIFLFFVAVGLVIGLLFHPLTAVSAPTPSHHAAVSHDPPYIVATPIVVFPPAHKGK